MRLKELIDLKKITKKELITKIRERGKIYQEIGGKIKGKLNERAGEKIQEVRRRKERQVVKK